ncbi:hypothetical protein [Saccharothrix syringae]|uniref:Transcriptional regulator n=1 Tax=Saccharothrix syringae TaxID=103733 RepID=A0A5Q0GYI9_SACSY|nr:hypothetical protein [Saccharothrix syringae]QFZ18452.1 hypothetical protein EKG83_14040 [Saccharothrix syringae]
MAARNRIDNHILRTLMKESKWTNQNLSLAVNRAAAEAGVIARYDRTSVSHWLSGSKPRPPVPVFVAEAFSRRLGRFVSATDLGWADAVPDAPMPASDMSPCVTALHDLATADLDPARRAWLCAQPFRVTWGAVSPPGDEPGAWSCPAETGRHGTEATAAIEMALSAFLSLDRAFGGGAARLALATYLANDVTTRCSDTRARRELLTAAAELTRLMAFKCFDSLQHNLAQRYYRMSLRLSTEAGDHLGYARTLCGMSAQASFLGHHAQAVQLADTAVGHASGRAPARIRALLLGHTAVAHAMSANHRTALSHLAQAERYLSEVDDVRTPDAQAAQADLAHRTGLVLTLLRDASRAEPWLHTSLRHRPEGERRSRMLTVHALADLQLRRGNLEQACATWESFLDDYPYMHSERVDCAFRSFRRKLGAYQAHPAASRVLHQSRQSGD